MIGLFILFFLRKFPLAENFAICCQCTALLPRLPSLAQTLLETFAILACLTDGLLHKSAGIRLRPHLASHILETKSFYSSVPLKNLFLAIFLTLAFVLIGVPFPTPPRPNGFGTILLIAAGIVPLLGKTANEKQSHLFFLWESDLSHWLLKLWKNLNKDLGTSRAPQDLFHSKTSDQELKETPPNFVYKNSSKTPPHILFVVLESFRAKNVGALDCRLNLSPAFDAWSEKGVLFTNFHANSLLTSTAMIASLFGLLPMFSPSYLRSYIPLSLRGLPQILREQGYDTGMIFGGARSFQSWEDFFSKNYFLEVIGKQDLLNEFPDCETTSWGVHDAWIYKKALCWLSSKEKPSFLTLLTATNHHPWIAPASWSKAKKPSYQETFAYTDWALGQWLEQMQSSGLLKNSLIFIFADHGQGLGERNEPFIVNRRLFQENIHIPLLILGEGRIEAKKRIDNPSSQIDLLPTILDLLKIKTTHEAMGESLLRCPKKRPLFFLHPFQESPIGIRENNWKWTQDRSSHVNQLYNLKNDAEERQNLALDRTDLIDQMSSKGDQVLEFLKIFYQQKKENTALSKTPRRYFSFLEHCAMTNKLPKRTLDLSHRLSITDEWIIHSKLSWKMFSRINLSYCSLLTDAGVNFALEQSISLEGIDLQGVDEFTAKGAFAPKHLQVLNLRDCKSLDPFYTIHWIRKLPDLTHLAIDGEHFRDFDWLELIKIVPNLVVLFIQNGLELNKAAFCLALDKIPHLHSITFENCPELEDGWLALMEGKNLRSLSLDSCHRITGKGLDCLLETPLERLFIRNCPSVQRFFSEKWLAKEGTLVSMN